MLIGQRNSFRRDEEIEIALSACTTGGAKVMGLDRYGTAAGCTTDLLLVPGETLAEAVASRPAVRAVIKRGKVIVRHGELIEAVAS